MNLILQLLTSSFQEFALLFAIAAPIAVLVAMNVFLALEGERGTLMFPTWTTPEGRAEPALLSRAAANESEYLKTA